MKSNQILISTLGALCAGLCFTFAVATAQTTPEEQARTILGLFEAGQKDSAYALLEPLKKTARFVPAVIYARAQMTPDDRALGLYKELVVLDPEGPYADRALAQLVARYADKRDSLAAHVWVGVLHRDYPKSSLVSGTDSLLAAVKSWRAADDLAEAQPGKSAARPSKPPVGSATKPPTGSPSKPPTGSTARPATGTAAKPPTGGTSTGGTAAKPTTRDTTQRISTGTKPSTGSPSAKGMHGYALQVGLYPTKAEAASNAAILKGKGLTAVALPKTVSGAKQYALVVGPYASVAEATKKKATVNGACGCKSFVVQVQ